MKKNKVGLFIKKIFLTKYFLFLALLTTPVSIAIAFSVTNTFQAGDSIESAKINTNFSELGARSWELSGSDLYYTTGNVGIGTTSPNAELHVFGAIDADGFYAYETGGTYAFMERGTNNDGKVQFGGYHDNGYFTDTLIDGSTLALQTRSGGRVGIGTTSPSYKLHVNGTIGTTNTGQVHSDYVFESDYKLKSLEELEEFINKEKHLPGIVTDPEKAKHIDIMDFNGKLLEKIEELTLHTIAQQKDIKSQRKRIEELEARFNKL